ncbi:MAG: hypothetical protein H0X33_11955 [Taibaiella sp.]|nr:hypothetical protein [Taibaiella sp.]
MQELIDELKTKAGLTQEQSVQALATIKDFIKSKLPPMMSGMVDSFMGSTATHEDDFMDTGTGNKEASLLEKAKKVTAEAKEKIEDLRADAKEDVEEFAKEASEKINEWALKADEAAKDAIDKLKGMIDEQENLKQPTSK